MIVIGSLKQLGDSVKSCNSMDEKTLVHPLKESQRRPILMLAEDNATEPRASLKKSG